MSNAGKKREEIRFQSIEKANNKPLWYGRKTSMLPLMSSRIFSDDTKTFQEYFLLSQIFYTISVFEVTISPSILLIAMTSYHHRRTQITRTCEHLALCACISIACSGSL